MAGDDDAADTAELVATTGTALVDTTFAGGASEVLGVGITASAVVEDEAAELVAKAEGHPYAEEALEELGVGTTASAVAEDGADGQSYAAGASEELEIGITASVVAEEETEGHPYAGAVEFALETALATALMEGLLALLEEAGALEMGHAAATTASTVGWAV